jgi:hypothetical protein
MKKRFVFLTLSLVLAINAARAQSPAQSTTVVVIRAGTLIDGSNASPRKNQLIFVRGNRIEKLAEGTAQIPEGATVIDLSGATVLPGLIRPASPCAPRAPPSRAAALWSKVLRQFVIWRPKARATAISK